MQKVILGKSGLLVSKLAYGTLTLSPLQLGFSPKDAADLFEYAYSKGINFFDTAELYDNYSHLNEFLKRDSVKREEVVLSTKSYAYDRASASKSLELALESIGTDYIDLFMLHEQESIHTLRGHKEAIDYFLEAKSKGLIKSFGISTHHVQGAIAASKFAGIDALHPIYNMKGLGIADGSREDMEEALSVLKSAGIGVFAMKPLGGGHFFREFEQSLKFVLGSSLVDSIAIGMKSRQEIDANINVLLGISNHSYKQSLPTADRKLMIHSWCTGCGACIDACHQGALSLNEGKCEVDHGKCVLCGYCSARCKDFCIKVI